ncbi:MAG: amino acid synthesis family protein [Pseudomonadota bacterium]
MAIEIRRTLLQVQNTHVEGGREVPESTTLVAAAAIIQNPWFGRGFVEDLSPEVREVGPVVGKVLVDMILGVTGDDLEGYGKASVVGSGGELEHAQALTHTLWFGNQYRDAVNAKTYLAFSNLRGAMGTSVVIPLMDKHDAGRRSHYQTIHMCIPDAPADDEIIVALGASVGGHPHHRIGDRYQDLKEMGHDVDNPAGV